MYFEIPLNLIQRKKFYELRRKTSQNRVKASFYSNIFFYVNLYLKSHGLKISKLLLSESNDTIQNVCISEAAIKQEYKHFKKIYSIEQEQNDLNDENQCIVLQNARDEANMSQVSYTRFRKRVNLISSYKLKSLNKLLIIKKKINRFYNIKKNSFGWYVNCQEKIEFTLKKIHKKLNGQILNNTFDLNLSGDGLVISKTNLNIITFVFRVLNEQSLSSNSLYTLGLFQVNVENYDMLKIALKEIIDNLKQIKSIEINNQIYNINYTQGGDLKWLSNMNGLKAANSINPCPWCNWNSKEGIKNPNKRAKYSIGTRTIDESIASAYQSDGYKNPPLIDFLEFKKSIFDPLHMCLRITDRLFDKFLSYLDLKDKNSTFNLDKRPNLKVLVEYVQEFCMISEPFHFDQNEKKVTIRSLNEKERLKILFKLEEKSLIDLYPAFNNDYKLRAFNAVFCDFFKIYKYLKKDNTNDFNRKRLEKQLNEWLDTYLLISETNKITPYMHILIDHVPEFIEEYKFLNQYSMQPVEKLNYVIKQNYFKQTNKRKDQYIKQLLEKHNRLEFMHLNGTLDELNEKLLRQDAN